MQVAISRLDHSLQVMTRFVLDEVPHSERGGSVVINIDGACTSLSRGDAERLMRVLQDVLMMPAKSSPSRAFEEG